MFQGTVERTIDAKGRLMLPPEFRQEHEAVVLTLFDGAVSGYPREAWKEVAASLAAIRRPNRKLRDFLRVFLGNAQEVPVDPQGRILIPQSLRNKAKLDKDVNLVGVGHKFEIWGQQGYEGLLDQDFDDISDDLDAAGAEVLL